MVSIRHAAITEMKTIPRRAKTHLLSQVKDLGSSSSCTATEMKQSDLPRTRLRPTDLASLQKIGEKNVRLHNR